MSVDLEPSQCFGVLASIEQSLVVFGPYDIGCHIGNHIVERRASVQIAESDVVFSAPDRIDCEREQPVVRADLQAADIAIVLSFGNLVDIQQDRFIALGKAWFFSAIPEKIPTKSLLIPLNSLALVEIVAWASP